MTCVHEMQADQCDYCRPPKSQTADDVGVRLWAAALTESTTPPAQCRAEIVPVPTTAQLDLLGDGRDFDPLRHRIATSPHYSHTVVVTPPPDRTRRLYDRLAEARPDWVAA